MIHYQTCPVCDCNKINKVLTAVDHTVSQESFEIWQCAHCSLRFTQDVPAPSDIGSYYQSENYISHSDTRKGLVNSLYLLVRKFTLSSKQKFIERISGLKNGRLLDVGAGTGAFLHRMKHKGWKVEGVEPDEQARKRAGEIYDLDLRPSPDLFLFEEGSFDVVTMWHVLEHVHDLHGYIEQIKKVCHPSGKICIAVPNYTSRDAGHYSNYWAAYDVPRHLYHFSPASMSTLLLEHGCKIESIHPMWFDSFYVSLLSEKYATGSSGLFKGCWNGLRSNSRALSNKRLASSVIYVVSVK